jgi:hypothetical protein
MKNLSIVAAVVSLLCALSFIPAAKAAKKVGQTHSQLAAARFDVIIDEDAAVITTAHKVEFTEEEGAILNGRKGMVQMDTETLVAGN